MKYSGVCLSFAIPLNPERKSKPQVPQSPGPLPPKYCVTWGKRNVNGPGAKKKQASNCQNSLQICDLEQSPNLQSLNHALYSLPCATKFLFHQANLLRTLLRMPQGIAERLVT